MRNLENPPRGRSFILRYGCAVVSIALATWVRVLLDPVLGDLSPFPTLIFGVLLTAWCGGIRPALVAVLLGVFSADYFLVPPRGSFGFKGAVQYVDMAFFLGVGVGIAVLGGVMQAAPLLSLRKLGQAREALGQTEERLRLTLRSSEIAIWSWDIAPNIVEADESCSVLFGLPIGQFPQTIEGFAALVHRDDRERIQQEVAASVEHGAEYNTQFRVVWPEGAVRSLAVRGKVYYGEAGRPDRLTGVCWDVTEHLQAAENQRTCTSELAEANQRLTILDRSKNEFLNLISHEFRTPLNGLLGVGELILKGMPSTEENIELQEMFDQSRRRIVSILDDALLLTQIDVNGEQFRSAPVSLHAALNRATQRATEFAESRRVTLAPPPVGLDFVLGDEELLVRALHTLLEAAVRFSEEGETVRLRHEVFPDSLRVVIESQGRTIPGSAMARFFERFSIGEASTVGRDVGLGPAVASRILSLFGASVSVANRDPSGIRLTITLRGVKQSGL
jgi:PAS domain S-box-containing protein